MAEVPECGFKKSALLSKEDVEKICSILGHNKKCLALTVGQISFSKGGNVSNRERVICFILDSKNKSYYLHVYYNTIFTLIWKECLKSDFGYVDCREYHVFKCSSQDVNVKFQNATEGREFMSEIRKHFKMMDVKGSQKLDLERKAAKELEKKRQKQSKENKKKKPIVRMTFGDPVGFKHVKHISSIFLDEDDIANIFEKAGIDPDKLTPLKTKQLLKAALEEEKSMFINSPEKPPEIEIIKTKKKATKKRMAPPPPPKTSGSRIKANESTPLQTRVVDFDSHKTIICDSQKLQVPLYNFAPKPHHTRTPPPPPMEEYEHFLLEQNIKSNSTKKFEVDEDNADQMKASLPIKHDPLQLQRDLIDQMAKLKPVEKRQLFEKEERMTSLSHIIRKKISSMRVNIETEDDWHDKDEEDWSD